jgi:hypothetical protein
MTFCAQVNIKRKRLHFVCQGPGTFLQDAQVKHDLCHGTLHAITCSINKWGSELLQHKK